MPVKYRITGLFALLVLVILGMVCVSVYYFSFINRIKDIRTRLTNRATTTGRMLSQTGVFDLRLMKRIDASTTVSLKNKFVEAFDLSNNKIYRYSDLETDTLLVPAAITDDARKHGNSYSMINDKDVVALHYTDFQNNMMIVEAAYDEEGFNKLKQLRLILWLSFAGGIIITLLSGYFFSGRLLQPLRKITDEVNEISAGSLTRRIGKPEMKITDEWSYLSTTLNQLLNRLQESFEIQGRFIANASHELTTPLTSISSQLEITLQRPRESVYYERMIRSVYEDVLHLNKLTISLLEFAKASGTSSGIEIDLLRIDEILLRLPAEMAKSDPGYSISLDFSSLPEQEEKLFIFGNEELLFSALNNIVLNACKYSPDHHANVELLIISQEIKILVEDKGEGISENDLEKVFQPFYRSESARSYDGFGLGLSLSNRIIKLHKGFIQVDSEINKGTRMTIVLPVASSFKGN
jgi:two-component system, OmpR family, sensor histidine kinase ArlS